MGFSTHLYGYPRLPQLNPRRIIYFIQQRALSSNDGKLHAYATEKARHADKAQASHNRQSS